MYTVLVKSNRAYMYISPHYDPEFTTGTVYLTRRYVANEFEFDHSLVYKATACTL